LQAKIALSARFSAALCYPGPASHPIARFSGQDSAQPGLFIVNTAALVA
jgi:hypothetical protein